MKKLLILMLGTSFSILSMHSVFAQKVVPVATAKPGQVAQQGLKKGESKKPAKVAKENKAPKKHAPEVVDVTGDHAL